MTTIALRWFTQKYPDLYKNFIHNSNVLTTLFDVCATLGHIPLYLNHPGDIITGQSLFTKIYKRSPLSIINCRGHSLPSLNGLFTLFSTRIQRSLTAQPLI